MFKRRDKRGTVRIVLEAIYPPGGWGRAFNYMYYRLKRLPDPPHRIARGIAAGIFTSFSPLFGLHFFLAGFFAWLLRGNVGAAIISTFVGNPITFPFIAASSMFTGNLLLGRETTFHFHALMLAFKRASGEVWWNMMSIFNGTESHWENLVEFNHEIFLPYLLGGAINGLIISSAAYALAHPLIDAYQRRRSRLLQQKLQARLKIRSGAMVK
ncbi:DUF2062 domain-containing protein [Mangrovicoccus ximenensis]|uniref:DUF2062 domain-containing protein n=1 Tax=Mangrovicoccus ximenensis TaxID=1911570 RepID=UPI000D399A2E|nr:DUF2062 domain-containing protein [Mangrovicoccus ximenensis]